MEGMRPAASVLAADAAEPEVGRSLAACLARRAAGRLGRATCPLSAPGHGAEATRVASGKGINAMPRTLPTLIGGSADLTPSNNTRIKGLPASSRASSPAATCTSACENTRWAPCSTACHCTAASPYGGTFLIFSDYMRPAIRLAALMELPVIYVFTHDSIGLGEDGPTHQPVEHLAALRAIPNLDGAASRGRQRDGRGVAGGPAAPRRTRRAHAHPQNLPTIDRTKYGAASGIARGAYVLCRRRRGGDP